MNYAEIKNCDVANGEGVRVSLFVSGCTHRCKGCFNAMAWDFQYGEVFDSAVEEKLLVMLQPGYIAGLTLLGGEPLEPQNQRALLPFLQKLQKRLPEKTIWCYTGYTLEADLLAQNGRAHCECTDELLQRIDVLVDGEYVEEQKNISLIFKGSENQRIIDLKKTLECGKLILSAIEQRNAGGKQC